MEVFGTYVDGKGTVSKEPVGGVWYWTVKVQKARNLLEVFGTYWTVKVQYRNMG